MGEKRNDESDNKQNFSDSSPFCIFQPYVHDPEGHYSDKPDFGAGSASQYLLPGMVYDHVSGNCKGVMDRCRMKEKYVVLVDTAS